MKYPTSMLKTIEDIQEGFKYNRSSLGLWGLQNAFYKGAYKVRTTNFEHIKEIKPSIRSLPAIQNQNTCLPKMRK